jgi:hypothetical protein
VLFERKRDVDVVDPFRPDDVVGIREGSEKGKASVADMVARCAVVDESDDLETELAVLEDFVSHHPSEVSSACYQNSFEPYARLPAPLERFTNDLPRQIGQCDVDYEKEDPDPLRDLLGAGVLQFV